MNKNLMIGIIATVVVLLVGATVLIKVMKPEGSTTDTEQAAVVRVVEDFGSKLKNVSLTAEPVMVAASIKENYERYVSPQLLEQWMNDPASAPGRATSSPWPDSIEVTSTEKIAANEYEVLGNILEQTSVEVDEGGYAAIRPIKLTVSNMKGEWFITGVTLGDYDQSPSDVTAEDWKTLELPQFTLSYPPDFTVKTEDSAGGEFLETSLAKISFPSKTFKDNKTNYNEAYLVVSMSKSSSTVATCTDFKDIPGPLSTDTGSKTINDVTWKTKSTVGAAAGNRYNTRLFRTVKDGTCYEVGEIVHTSVAENYDPPRAEFDQELAFVVLEQITNSIHLKTTLTAKPTDDMVATSTADGRVRMYGMEEVAKHGSKTDCWSAINDSVYDLTAWIAKHPGGEEAIIQICGKDGSKLFNGMHGGKQQQADILAGFKIGELGK